MFDWLYRLAGKGVKSRSIEKLVNLPEIVFIDNREKLDVLRRKFNPADYVFVHAPDIAEKFGEEKKFKKIKVNAYTISKNTVQNAMAELYSSQAILGDRYSQTLASLEDSIKESAAQKEQSMARLSAAAGMASGIDEIQTRAIIEQIISSTYEVPEYLMREGIQNAYGSSADKQNNRIDVYVDREQRLVRFDDLGRGMSREEINDAFFNIYRSINEALSHAPGKFGIGVLSFFGLKYDYVRVDSQPEFGIGGMTEVESNLYRDSEFMPSTRARGTSVEIKFANDSPVNFDLLEKILYEDCSFIDTPLYLHSGGQVWKM